MATIIGGVSIKIGAVAKGFAKTLGRARAVLGKFISGIGMAAKRIARFGVIMAGVAAGAMVLFIKRSLASLDSLAKVSRQLDISAESLNTFRLAAKLGGTDTGIMEKALLRLNKNVSDANVGLTTAVRAFDALGLSSRKLAGMNTDDQFEAIAKAMQGVESQTDKVRIALDLFGRGGAPILNVMEQDLAAVRDRVREVDTSFTKLELRRVEEANDAIAEMAFGFKALSDRATIVLAPALESIADTISSWLASVDDAGQKTFSVIEFIGKAIGFTVTAIERVILGWKRFRIVAATVASGVVRGLKVITDAQQAVARAFGLEFADDAARVVNNLVNANHAVLAAMKEDAAQFASGVGAAALEIDIMLFDARKAMEAAGQSTDGAKKKTEDYSAAIEAAAKRYSELERSAVRFLDSIETPQARMMKSMEELSQVFEAGLVTLEQWQKVSASINKEFRDATKAVEETAVASRRASTSAPGLAGAEVAGSAAAVRGTLGRGNSGLNDLVAQGKLQARSLASIDREQRLHTRWLRQLTEGTATASLN